MDQAGSARRHPDGGSTLATLLANEKETSRSVARPASVLESTRVWLWNTFFTSLCGVTFRDWCAILRDNRFAVDWPYWPQAAILTAGCGLNSLFLRKEMKAFGARLADVRVHPPLFILGHWRSGTTLLHNMLALDDQFAYPNLYEVFFPHTFLGTEEYRAGQIAGLVPATRLIDSMAQGMEMPNEDEFATCALSLRSPYMLWSFPRNTAHYERFLTFRGVPEADVARWKVGLRAVPQEADRAQGPADAPEVAAAHRADQASPRALPRRAVPPHPPRAVHRLPVDPAPQPGPDPVAPVPEARPRRRRRRRDPPLPAALRRLFRGAGADPRGTAPRSRLRGARTRPHRPDADRPTKHSAFAGSRPSCPASKNTSRP